MIDMASVIIILILDMGEIFCSFERQVHFFHCSGALSYSCNHFRFGSFISNNGTDALDIGYSCECDVWSFSKISFLISLMFLGTRFCYFGPDLHAVGLYRWCLPMRSTMYKSQT